MEDLSKLALNFYCVKIIKEEANCQYSKMNRGEN